MPAFERAVAHRSMTVFVSLLALATLAADRRNAATTTLTSVAEGEYWEGQPSRAYSGNFRASNNPFFIRNYLVFDLASITDTISAATLVVPGYDATIIGVDPISFNVYQVATPTGVLLAGGDGTSDIHGDLGDGALYGATIVPAPPAGNNSGGAQMPDVTVALGGAVADLNASRGFQFAVGGTTTGPSMTILWVGITTGSQDNKARLVLETTPVPAVPLPPTLALMATALGGGALLRARRRHRAP